MCTCFFVQCLCCRSVCVCAQQRNGKELQALCKFRPEEGRAKLKFVCLLCSAVRMKWHSVAVVTAVMTVVVVVGIGTSSLVQSREGGGRRQPLGIHHNASRSSRLLAGEGTLQVHPSLCHCR